MNIGKKIRINRLFAHPSGKFCSVAIDHFAGNQVGMPDGLRDIQSTLAAVMAEVPDAVTMHKGVAASCWGPYAGKVPFILQSTLARADDTADENIASPEDAVRLGADAFAVCAFVRGKTEGAHIRRVADCVRDAVRWDIPVILHTYPRRFKTDGSVEISFEPEEIAWAVRCGIEAGVDIIKVPFTGDAESYGQIVRSCPVPMVAAGGPKTPKLVNALELAAGVIASGARGLTIGRNIWGMKNVRGALAAFKAVIHDGAAPSKAMEKFALQD